MVSAADENLGAAGEDDTFDLVLADAGYCSEQNLLELKEASTPSSPRAG